MHLRFLLGPAGSGKTFRCLDEIRRALVEQPDGAPLVLLAPKQATFQLERQLLGDQALPGYARLQILSFERLAEFVLERLGRPEPRLLAEEGRVMVLRALLAREQRSLELFHASARLPGFARQLSELLREFQRHQVGSARLLNLAGARDVPSTLGAKLKDAARLLEGYVGWLEAHGLEDADQLLDLAAAALADRPPAGAGPLIDWLWLDGFAEMTPQELTLLTAVSARCRAATLAFCLDQMPPEQASLLSAWGVIGETFRKCHARLRQLPGAVCEVELLDRDPVHDRFAGNPVLRHLEANFARPRPAAWGRAMAGETAEFDFGAPAAGSALTLWSCANLAAEAEAAAAEVMRHVQAGGRYREIAVLGRSLDAVAPVFRRVFQRAGIPCFVDQRAPVNHHPLAELTRSALRTLVLGWRHEDWFGMLKSGLVGLPEWEADRLENESLAHGWDGSRWRSSLGREASPAREALRARLVEPVLELEARLGPNPSGRVLAWALRQLWSRLGVDRTLVEWDRDEVSSPDAPDDAGTRHTTVGRQLDGWLGEIERAFPEESLALAEWLPVLESALGGLTVGRVPPALDQVLIGAIDRSRNPDLQVVILPGWNEGVFPERPATRGVLSEMERDALALAGASLGPPLVTRVGHERYYAYIALTRARARVAVTWSVAGSLGEPVRASSFVGHLRRLFPEIAPGEFATPAPSRRGLDESVLAALPGGEALAQPVASRLFGRVLRSSISRLEQFGACPFRYFAGSALRLDERRLFELDARERGSFQHVVLAQFHREVVAGGRCWSGVDPAEARLMVRRLCRETALGHRGGLLHRSGSAVFTGETVGRQLEDLVAETVRWMKRYGLNPDSVELAFGGRDAALPAWVMELGDGFSLELSGQIDRVDLGGENETGQRWVVVVDYKSSPLRLDPVLAGGGIQMQLPFYLSAYSALAARGSGAGRMGGMAYASLRGEVSRQSGRSTETGGPDTPRFAVRGRFRMELRPALQRPPGPGDSEMVRTPFSIRVKKDGQPMASSDLLAGEDFDALMAGVEPVLRDFGLRIVRGAAQVAPYRHAAVTACDRCDFRDVCRVDPERVRYRRIQKPASPAVKRDPELSSPGI